MYLRISICLKDLINPVHKGHIVHDDKCDPVPGTAETVEQVHDPCTLLPGSGFGIAQELLFI